MHTNESSRMTSNFSNTSRVKHKIIFLGDQHVGKTCIIERFMYDVFDEKPHVLVIKKMGIEQKRKYINNRLISFIRNKREEFCI